MTIMTLWYSLALAGWLIIVTAMLGLVHGILGFFNLIISL